MASSSYFSSILTSLDTLLFVFFVCRWFADGFAPIVLFLFSAVAGGGHPSVLVASFPFCPPLVFSGLPLFRFMEPHASFALQLSGDRPAIDSYT